MTDRQFYNGGVPIAKPTIKTKWIREAKPILGGTLSLAIAMGIGRFAYTPILPLMQSELHFSSSFAGILASMNYIGYLIGAVIASYLPLKTFKLQMFTIRTALTGSIVTTGAMAFTQSYLFWFILRGLGGVFSALILVFTSSVIMNWLSRKSQLQHVGLFYAGVGIGIVLTGTLVPGFAGIGSWQTAWFGLGIISCILGLCAWFFLSEMDPFPSEQAPITQSEESPAPFKLWGITVAYGIEGLAYIVMGTFITVYFSHMSSVPWLGNVSWILVGASAIPSTSLWSHAAQKWGWKRAIYIAFLLQAVGFLLPVIVPSVISAVISAILYGGTLMGITTLALSIGRQCAPKHSHQIIGKMTALYSVGQVLGLIGAGVIANIIHSYTL